MDDCSSEAASDMNDIVEAVVFSPSSGVVLLFYMKARQSWI